MIGGIGCAAAAMVDEVARYRVPQRLARTVANLHPQGPIRTRRRLPGPGEAADEMTVGQPARHAVGLAVVAFRVVVAIREGQHPGRMRLPASGKARPDRPADERPPGVGERPLRHVRPSRPRRRVTVQACEQEPGAGEERQRQRRQEDGAALRPASAVPAAPARGLRVYASRHWSMCHVRSSGCRGSRVSEPGCWAGTCAARKRPKSLSTSDSSRFGVRFEPARMRESGKSASAATDGLRKKTNRRIQNL